MRGTTKLGGAFALLVAACGLFPDLSSLGGDAAVSDAGADMYLPDACPTGRGPTMLAVDPKTCIDSTEVTVAQYRTFYNSVDAAFPQVAQCAWNTTFLPSSNIPGTTKDAYPITGVNWCQANAFCAWAGKALCGAPDGGAFSFTSYTDPNESVWMRACSANGAQAYPYGSTFQGGACNLAPLGDASSSVAPVTSFNKCVGSIAGLYDMLGNVSEWENACTSTGTASVDECRRRGGGFDDLTNATCSFDESDTRNHQSGTSGFRCCAILP